jgi:uncharacterized sulfatase
MKRQAILFLIDTQGANCVGCYAGNPRLGTPNIDRLAGQGVRFDRAYTCAPVCGPARSALLTGLYPHVNGVLANDQAPHADLPTLGRRLRDAGIATGYVGKWHLDGTDYFGDGRCPDGWDPAYWFDGRNYLDSLPDAAARDLSRRVLGPDEVARHGITAEFTHAHRIAERARRFVEAHRDRDFLLVVSIDEPHHPFICPEPFVSAFRDFEFPLGPAADDPLTDKPRSQREWAAHFEGRRGGLVRRPEGVFLRHPAYFGCNSYCDHEVGRVVEAIDRFAHGALVVHTSDHGDLFHAHRLAGKGPAAYEEVARIPLIVRWTGGAPAGAISPHPVSHIDLVPTFLEHFGVPVPPLLQGRALQAQIRDPGHRTNRHVFIEFNRFEIDHDGFGSFSPLRAVFDGRRKLVINLLDTDELYDLTEDPAELHNRIGDPATAAERDALHDALLEWQGATRDVLRGPHWARRAWRDLGGSTWGGPTRPRPFDEAYFPRTLLYDTGREIDRFCYDKG